LQQQFLKTKFKDKSDFFIYEELSRSGANEVRNQVEEVPLKTGDDIVTRHFGDKILMCKFLTLQKLIGLHHLFQQRKLEIKNQ